MQKFLDTLLERNQEPLKLPLEENTREETDELREPLLE